MGQNDKDEVFTLKLDSIPSVTTNLKLVICASAPQSNGISRAYSKAAEFIAPQTPVTTAISLKSAYDQKYGTPSTGVNGNQKCSNFGNSECSIFGINTTVLLASAVQ